MKTKGRAARNIAWIEEHCVVPEGALVGQRMKLHEYQRKFLRAIYDAKVPVRRAILSVARKNGKSTLAAAMVLLHLCGPEFRRNAQLFSTALSLDQSTVIYSLAAKMAASSPSLSQALTLRDTRREIVCQSLGTRFQSLSAEAKTKHGMSPSFVIHDELGQVEGPRSALYDTIETGMGAHDDPISIIISTQAPTENDLLSRLMDDARSSEDPRIVVHCYETPEDVDPFNPSNLRASNPGLGKLLNFEVLDEARALAQRMPSAEASFRNLNLNQRVDSSTPFVSRSIWEACGAPPEEFAGYPIAAGLDLSTSRDLTACVWVARIDGRWHVRPEFWLPEDGLREKSRADRVPYDVWVAQGYLLTTPGSAIDRRYIANHLFERCRDWDVRSIAYDRWDYQHLRPWLQQVGFPDWALEGEEMLFREFGQGYASMSPALRTLETRIAEEQVCHGKHPVLSMCAGNAVVDMDPAGNRKLNKAKSRGRIDGLVALAMAVAEGDRTIPEEVDVTAGEIWYA